MFIPETENQMNRNSGFTPSDSFRPEVAKTPPAPKRNAFQKARDTLGEFSEGFAKGEISTFEHLQELGMKIGEKINLPAQIAEFVTDGRMKAKDLSPQKTVLQQNVTPETREDMMTPEGGAQKFGFYMERMSEFLLAGPRATAGINAQSSIAKNAVLSKTGSKVLSTVAQLGVKSAGQGTFAGGLTAIQRGEVDREAKTAALIGAAFPILEFGAKALGSSIMNRVIKPSNADVKNGFTKKNITKHDLGGSLNRSLEKTSHKLNTTSSQLDDILEKSNATIDIDGVYSRTAARVGDRKKILFGRVSDMKGGLKELSDDIAEMSSFLGDTNMKVVPIKVANHQIKRGAGTKGAWVFGRIDKNAAAIDEVYSVFYNELKKEIEKQGPPGINALNKQLGELIPIQSALIRRIPVAERSNAIGLEGNMAILASIFDPSALAIMFPMIASKSGTVANILMKASDSFLGKAAGAGIKAGISSSPKNQ